MNIGDIVTYKSTPGKAIVVHLYRVALGDSCARIRRSGGLEMSVLISNLTISSEAPEGTEP